MPEKHSQANIIYIWHWISYAKNVFARALCNCMSGIENVYDVGKHWNINLKTQRQTWASHGP